MVRMSCVCGASTMPDQTSFMEYYLKENQVDISY